MKVFDSLTSVSIRSIRVSQSSRVACPDVLLMPALSPCSSRPSGEHLLKTDQVVDQPDGIPQHPDRLPVVRLFCFADRVNLATHPLPTPWPLRGCFGAFLSFRVPSPKTHNSP